MVRLETRNIVTPRGFMGSLTKIVQRCSLCQIKFGDLHLSRNSSTTYLVSSVSIHSIWSFEHLIVTDPMAVHLSVHMNASEPSAPPYEDTEECFAVVNLTPERAQNGQDGADANHTYKYNTTGQHQALVGHNSTLHHISDCCWFIKGIHIYFLWKTINLKVGNWHWLAKIRE